MLSIPIFALAYMVKGGQFPIYFGKAFSCFIVFNYMIWLTDVGLFYSLAVTAAWILAVAPSMGEEAGSIGRYKHWWGDYKDAYHQIKDGFIFNRSYGVLKGIQRGVFMGACFALALYPAPVVWVLIPTLAVSFVAAHYIGQEIYWREYHKDNWVIAEALLGSLIGLFLHLALGILKDAAT